MYLISNVKPVTAPQTVANVKATATADGASVTWTNNTANDVTSYNVYRQLAGDSTFSLVGTSTGGSFVDTTAANGTYNYTVTAVAYQGGESKAGAPVTVNAGTGTATAPSAPANVAAAAAQCDERQRFVVRR